MIPQTLKLTNFMCYQQVEVDFSGLHLTCLSGNNGSGKSALLAAMTWALWGKARDKVSDDELTMNGSVDMLVDFSFLLGSQLYRVQRKHTMKAKGHSQLSLQVRDEPTNSWRTLNERGVRETQNRIIEILRMDYETFINSAFLVQGRADEFARKAPGERKNVLASILGLDYYDKLQERAKRRLADAEGELRQRKYEMDRIDSELAGLPELERKRDDAIDRLIALDERLDGLEASFDRLRQSFSQLEGKHDELVQLEQTIRDLQGERDAAEAEMQRAERRLTVARETLRDRDRVVAGYNELQQVRAEVDERSGVQQQHAELTRSLQVAENDLLNARRDLERDLKSAREEQRRVAEQAGAVESLRAEHLRQQQIVADYEALADQQATTEQQRQKLIALVAATEDEIKRLDKENEKLRDRLKMLKQSDHQQCPVCGKALAAGEYEKVAAHYTEEGVSRKEQVEDLRHNVVQLREELQQAEVSATELARRVAGRSRAQQQVATATSRLQEAEAAAQQLATCQRTVATLEQQLAEDEYGQAQRVTISRLQPQIAALGYDAAAHTALRNRLQGLRDFDKLFSKLQQAESEAQRAEFEYIRAQDTRNNKQVVIVEREKHHSHLAAELRDYAARKAEVDNARAHLQLLKNQREIANNEQSALSAEVNILYNRKAERERIVLDHAAAAEQQGIYTELAQALGKKGVQAMIIESAIPELEDESNNILGRMTDGRMQVKFVTQKETKRSDSVVETLDLEVADDGNYRSYELYSGGEAFRINFAIRVAMSKLLANRAGARLQTLIIDEGFGTQDGSGRERVVQAIRAIQHDFECIFIITHIQELKDEFPTRIEVQRGTNGSTVEVIIG